METLKLQARIRENAQSIQDFSSDLQRWEANIKTKDATLRQQKRPAASTAAQHTYDTGYKRWEAFDVDAELERVDNAESTSATASAVPTNPAALVPRAAHDGAPAAFPAAAPTPAAGPRDEAERERGNELFRRGEFARAVQQYTRALGLNPRSAAALSNRAMAQLKLGDFAAAEADCCGALALDAAHVKSLARRAAARNAQGRHRLALLDLARALQLEPRNRQAAAELARTRELVRSSARRAPRQRVAIARDAEQPEAAAAEPEQQQAAAAAEPEQQQAAAPTKPEPVALTPAALPPPRLPERAPRTLYELEKTWAELRAHASLRRQYLLGTVGAAALSRVFARAPPEADLLCELLRSLASAQGPEERAAAGAAAEALARAPKLDMTLMFLAGPARAELREALAAGGLGDSALAALL